MMIEAGACIPFQTFPPISQDSLNAYAAASGDRNEIHLDDEVAKKMGLPGVIAHGMFVAGVVTETVLAFVRQESVLSHYELVKLQSKFRGMVLLGDILSVGGVVKEVGKNSLVIEAQARNQRAELTTQVFLSFKK